jgi:hypothetical protein
MIFINAFIIDLYELPYIRGILYESMPLILETVCINKDLLNILYKM